jgi:hypothetical protein
VSSFAEDLLEIRRKTKDIQHQFQNTGTIEPEDLNYLCEKAIRHTIMAGIAENDWIVLKTLQLTSEVEIEELKRQLEEKQ